MNRFITLSVFGLFLSELVIFLLAAIRKLSVSGSVSGMDPVGAIAIFTFLGFSLATFVSLMIVLFAALKQRPVKWSKPLTILALLAWIPALIALLTL